MPRCGRNDPGALRGRNHDRAGRAIEQLAAPVMMRRDHMAVGIIIAQRDDRAGDSVEDFDRVYCGPVAPVMAQSRKKMA